MLLTSDETIPYKLDFIRLVLRIQDIPDSATYGIWLITKKMSNVNYIMRRAVSHRNLESRHTTALSTKAFGIASAKEWLDSLTPVHIRRCSNLTLRSGAATSGRRGMNGFIRSRKRTEDHRNSVSR